MFSWSSGYFEGLGTINGLYSHLVITKAKESQPTRKKDTWDTWVFPCPLIKDWVLQSIASNKLVHLKYSSSCFLPKLFILQSRDIYCLSSLATTQTELQSFLHVKNRECVVYVEKQEWCRSSPGLSVVHWNWTTDLEELSVFPKVYTKPQVTEWVCSQLSVQRSHYGFQLESFCAVHRCFRVSYISAKILISYQPL